MYIGRIIHKLFQPFIECPRNRALRTRHGSELRSNRDPVEVHAVDPVHAHRPLQTEAEQRVIADLPPCLADQVRGFIHIAVIGELNGEIRVGKLPEWLITALI